MHFLRADHSVGRTLAAVWLSFSASSFAFAYSPQEGDIVFQTSLSSQSRAIQIATGSPYSHMGVVLFQNGKPYVYEAVQPVKYTPLQAWLARGKGGHYVAKRTRKPLGAAAVATFHSQARKYAGRPYDLTFEWSDGRMYCSELVWKLYKAAGIELAPLAKLGSFNLDHPAVRRILKQRYGDHVPLDEPVIAPAAIFDSPLLTRVAGD